VTEGTGPYRAMPRALIAAGEIALRAVEPGDTEAIRQWRNEQMEVLRQTAPITPDAQARYFAVHVWPEKRRLDPSQILLAIERAGQLIGYGGLVHLSWPNRRAELSFLLSPELEDDSRTRAAVFGRFLDMVRNIAFADLKLQRLFTETFAHRDRHIETLEAAGFVREGRLRMHVVVDGVPTDAIIHGCLATDWEKGR
jgi:RimJ/RimL family protein N-acetyltransferase